jgi:hypothetical protein
MDISFVKYNHFFATCNLPQQEKKVKILFELPKKYHPAVRATPP